VTEYRVLEVARSETAGLNFAVIQFGDDQGREVARFYRREEADAYARWLAN
jgi:hypothetical protein